VTLLLVVGGVSYAVAADSSDDVVPVVPATAVKTEAVGGSRDATAAPGARAEVGGVSAEIADAFDVFRLPAKPRDRTEADFFSARFGANPEFARFARFSPDGAAMHLLPANGMVCLQSSTRIEGGCVDVESALSGDNAEAIVCAPGLPHDQVEVFGILPDGVVDAKVGFADGTSAPLDVQGNVYALRSPRQRALPTAIQFTLAGEKRMIATNVPRDAGSEPCGS